MDGINLKIMDKRFEPLVLTYEGEAPAQPSGAKTEVEMVPSPRPGVLGWIKDLLFGVQMEPHVFLVLDKGSQSRLAKHMKNFSEAMKDVASCAVTAEDIKSATKRMAEIYDKQ